MSTYKDAINRIIPTDVAPQHRPAPKLRGITTKPSTVPRFKAHNSQHPCQTSGRAHRCCGSEGVQRAVIEVEIDNQVEVGPIASCEVPGVRLSSIVTTDSFRPRRRVARPHTAVIAIGIAQYN